MFKFHQRRSRGRGGCVGGRLRRGVERRINEIGATMFKFDKRECGEERRAAGSGGWGVVVKCGHSTASGKMRAHGCKGERGKGPQAIGGKGKTFPERGVSGSAEEDKKKKRENHLIYCRADWTVMYAHGRPRVFCRVLSTRRGRK
jgi:hypothetical protein